MADNQQPNPPVPHDPEQQRQFEQFQQFQQFLRFQETQGQLPPGQTQPPQGPKPRPKWLKILLSKGFRRLVGLAVLIFAVVYGFNTIGDWLNPGRKDDGLGVQGGQGPGQKSDPGKEPGNPNEILHTLYQDIAAGTAQQACYHFDSDGARQFAANYGAASCEEAVGKLRPNVANLEEIPRIRAVAGQTVVVSSCQLRVKPGTTALGTFTLKPFGNLWIIGGHQLTDCPAPTTTSGPKSTTTTTRPSN